MPRIEIESPSTERSGYEEINGFRIFYQMQGEGRPALYLPAALGTAGVVRLSKNRMWISPDFRGHGRSSDNGKPISYDEFADDVAALLEKLGVAQVDVLAVCSGGYVALRLATRHEKLVRRLATYGTGYKRESRWRLALGLLGPSGTLRVWRPELFAELRGNRKGGLRSTADGHVWEFQRSQYQAVAPDPSHWASLFARANTGALKWKGVTDDELRSITIPTMIGVGDHGWIKIEHCAQMARLIPNAQLAVIPNAGHNTMYAEPDRLLPVVEQFFDEPLPGVPFATVYSGYHSGRNR